MLPVVEEPPRTTTMREELTAEQYRNAAIAMMEAALRTEQKTGDHDETLVDAELVLQRLGYYDFFSGVLDEEIEEDDCGI